MIHFFEELACVFVFILPTAETYDLYCNAIQDAFELIQGKDEDFVPGFDAYADVSNLSNMSQLSEATPGRENNLLALNDSSIFTPNTHSKPKHRKTISTSNKKSSERHSTPVRSDICSIPEDTPPSDLLRKPVEIRKNGGRKRSKRNGEEGKEQIGSESKKRKLSAEGRKSAGRKSAERKSAGRKSAGRPKKQSSVSELDCGVNGDADNSHEEDPVTKRLNFDTDHDLSGQLDILQVHHPSQRTGITYSSSGDSAQVPSMDIAMSSSSDTSTEHGGPRPSQGSSIPDRATTKTTSSKKSKNRAKKNGKSSKCAEDSSENGAVRKGKSKEDRKSSTSSVTGDQDTGALLPPGSLCEGDMTTTEVTMGNVREERKEERKEEKEKEKTEEKEEEKEKEKKEEKEEEKEKEKKEEKEEEKEKEKKEEKEEEKEEERKEEENEKKEERHFQYESDSEVSYSDDASELESSESESEDSLPAVNMEVNESVRGEFVEVKLDINAVGLANVDDLPTV